MEMAMNTRKSPRRREDQCRAGRVQVATASWPLHAAALAGVLLLAACNSGGSGGGPVAPGADEPMTPVAMSSAAVLVSGLHFDYALARADSVPVAEAGSVGLDCPTVGCGAGDLRELAGRDGTGMRAGFATVTGASGGPPLTEVFSEASATVSEASFTRYGFWGEHGYAAVEIGTGALSASADGQRWNGTFLAAHAWAAGEPSRTNPAGVGSAVWRGIAGAARTRDFAHLEGTVELRVTDLSRPLVEVDISLDGIDDPLRWAALPPAHGRFTAGALGRNYLAGRFHGDGHEEAWGVFDTGAYAGAFGAKRE